MSRISSLSTHSATVREPHGARQLDDGAQHGLRTIVTDDVPHEAAIDLEAGDRQGLQVGERAQAAPEIVERDVETEFAQAAHQRFGADDVRDRGRLGQLERQQCGRQAALAQRVFEERAELLVADRLARDVHGETGAALQQLAAAGASVCSTLPHHPPVDGGRELVALGGREELVRGDALPGLVGHAQQQLELRAGRRAVQGHDGLRFETEAILRQREAQRADQGHVRVAAHDALVAVLVGLDAVAAAILGRLAGDLRRSERMGQRMLALDDARDAEAGRDLDRPAAGDEAELRRGRRGDSRQWSAQHRPRRRRRRSRSDPRRSAPPACAASGCDGSPRRPARSPRRRRACRGSRSARAGGRYRCR